MLLSIFFAVLAELSIFVALLKWHRIYVDEKTDRLRESRNDRAHLLKYSDWQKDKQQSKTG